MTDEKKPEVNLGAARAAFRSHLAARDPVALLVVRSAARLFRVTKRKERDRHNAAKRARLVNPHREAAVTVRRAEYEIARRQYEMKTSNAYPFSAEVALDDALQEKALDPAALRIA